MIVHLQFVVNALLDDCAYLLYDVLDQLTQARESNVDTGTFDPNRPIDLTWDDKFNPVVNALCARLMRPSRLNKHLVARALLLLLCETRPPTPNDVITNVHMGDRPRGGWVDFDRAKWLEYIPGVVAALRSDNPVKALGL